MSALVNLKISSIFILWVMAFFFGILPVCWKKFRGNQFALSQANAFSGGLFLALGMAHILPEAVENLENYQNGDEDEEEDNDEHEEEEHIFPWPYFAAVVAFSIVLLIDKVIFNGQHKHEHQDEEHDFSHQEQDKNNNNNKNKNKNKRLDSEIVPLTKIRPQNSNSVNISSLESDKEKRLAKQSLADEELRISQQEEELKKYNLSTNRPLVLESSIHYPPKNSELRKNKIILEKIDRGNPEYKKLHENSNANPFRNKAQIKDEEPPKSHYILFLALGGPAGFSGQSYALTTAVQTNNLVEKIKQNISAIKNKHQKNKNELQIKDKQKPKSPYILALAMGVHSVFGGQALGLTDSVANCVSLMVAIGTHKWAEAITIGVSFGKSLKEVGMKQTIIVISIFSVSLPIGIFIGIFLTGVNQLVQSIIMGASAGTFVYIATTEIIVEEFALIKYKWIKYFFFLIGFGIVVAIYFVENAMDAD